MIPIDMAGRYGLNNSMIAPCTCWNRWAWQTTHTNSPVSCQPGKHNRQAIARALADNSPILVADRQTGNLDTKARGDNL